MPAAPPAPAVAAKTPSALCRSTVGEEGKQQGQRRRRRERGADALERAGRHERRRVRGAGPQEARRAQRGEPRDVHPAPPQQVRGAPGEEEQPAERDEVGVRRPGQRGGGEAEVPAHGGRRDVDDGGVQEQDELGAGEEIEGRPPGFADHRSSLGRRLGTLNQQMTPMT
ncbi:hypothetical protein GCM10009801_56710 [Streptomyces albiaxialis]|uniref:Uncharacterized protein n=1 Tax=Streptomyces albiaxialis TaxID=329523 RepID=A0ABN2WGI0_9ACTN